MSCVLKMFQTYSVFVGHIPTETKKYELRDLFQGCGEIVDLVILDNSSSTYKYGFVRFTEPTAAYRAVSELNGWSLNGCNLVVDLSRDTIEKLRQEKAGAQVSVTDGCGPRKAKPKPQQDQKPNYKTDFITDTMYLTRLQESCTALNLQNNTTRYLKVNQIMEDINKATGDRCPLLWGTVDGAGSDFKEISQKIMERWRNTEGGKDFGKKSSAEFMSALRTIMKEITNVLDSIEVKGDIYMSERDMREIEQLKLEETLFREVKDELDLQEKGELQNLVSRQEIGEDCGLHAAEDVGNHQAHSVKASNGVKQLETDNCLDVREMDSSDEESKIKERNAKLNKHRHHMSDDIPEKETSSEEEGIEYNISDIDPAIIDYHLSKLSEMEANEEKRKMETANQVCSGIDQDIQKFYALMNYGEKPETDLDRSISRDSSISDGSNEGNIDDSGVESDMMGVQRIVGRQQSTPSLKTLSAGEVYVGKTLQGSKSQPNLRWSDPEQYVLKSYGKGRGMLAVSEVKVHENDGEKSGKCFIAQGYRREMPNIFENLRGPVGRGHQT